MRTSLSKYRPACLDLVVALTEHLIDHSASLRPPPWQRGDTTPSNVKPPQVGEPAETSVRVPEPGPSEAGHSSSRAKRAAQPNSHAAELRTFSSSVKARGKRRAEEEPLQRSRSPRLAAAEEEIMAEASRITDLMRSEIGVLDPQSMKEGSARGYVEDRSRHYSSNYQPPPPAKRTRYYSADDEASAPPPRHYGDLMRANGPERSLIGAI